MAISSVFTNNRSQAVRLPENVKKVHIRARGHERIIAPMGRSWDEFFLNGPHPSDEFMVERASQEQAAREGL